MGVLNKGLSMTIQQQVSGMRRLRDLVMAVSFVGLLPAAMAQTVPVLPQHSSFDGGSDGWVISGVATQYRATGGNPGGFVFGQGQSSEDPPRIHPPARYLGDWRPIFGCGVLEYDHRVIDARGDFCGFFPYSVNISGPGGTARWQGAFPPTVSSPWMHIVVPLSTASWVLQTGNWEQLLSNVTDIFIESETFCNTSEPDDQSGLDNITLRMSVAILQQPVDRIACAGAHVEFSITVAGGGASTFAWRKGGVPIDAAVNPSAATATLELDNVQAADGGSYDCVVTAACGSVTSEAATLTVCVGDFDCDGTVDFFDYDAFVTCFEGGACPPGKTADVDGDGAVDFFDYDAFVRAFESPC